MNKILKYSVWLTLVGAGLIFGIREISRSDREPYTLRAKSNSEAYLEKIETPNNPERPLENIEKSSSYNSGNTRSISQPIEPTLKVEKDNLFPFKDLESIIDKLPFPGRSASEKLDPLEFKTLLEAAVNYNLEKEDSKILLVEELTKFRYHDAADLFFGYLDKTSQGISNYENIVESLNLLANISQFSPMLRNRIDFINIQTEVDKTLEEYLAHVLLLDGISSKQSFRNTPYLSSITDDEFVSFVKGASVSLDNLGAYFDANPTAYTGDKKETMSKIRESIGSLTSSCLSEDIPDSVKAEIFSYQQDIRDNWNFLNRYFQD
jgi:hypothetical protein